MNATVGSTRVNAAATSRSTAARRPGAALMVSRTVGQKVSGGSLRHGHVHRRQHALARRRVDGIADDADDLAVACWHRIPDARAARAAARPADTGGRTLRSRWQRGGCPRGRRRRSPGRCAAACPSSRTSLVSWRSARARAGRPQAYIGPSPMPTMPLDQPPPASSRFAETDAERTPGTAAAASRRRSTRAPRSSGGPPLAWRFNSTTSSGSGTKPSGNWLSDANVRRNSPAATTRTSDTAIWATTSVLRTAKRRSPAIPRPASLSASPGVTLFSPITGATPAVIAERHARAAVNASTRQSSARSSDTVLCHVLNCCTRSALLHFANTSPNAAPVTATIRLSMKSSRAIRQRELPSARRTLSSRRRASARASSRLAMFAHATSSTSPTATTIAKSGVSKRAAQRRVAGGSRCQRERLAERLGPTLRPRRSAAARRGARRSPARGPAPASGAP